MLQLFTHSESTTVEKQVASNSESNGTTWTHTKSAEEASLGITSVHENTQHGDTDVVVPKPPHESPEINRLLTAAAINPHFCQQLLDNPAVAIALGYRNEQFALTAAEANLLCSIQATSLPEFAGTLYKRLQQK